MRKEDSFAPVINGKSVAVVIGDWSIVTWCGQF